MNRVVVAMGKYLDVGLLEPGDVVFSRANTRTSLAIRAATAYPYASHVAIVVHPLIWFEAVPTGVGYRFIEPDLVRVGDRLHLAMPIPKGEGYFVRRYSDQKNATQRSAAERDRISNDLISITSQRAFLNYASLIDFLATIKLGPFAFMYDFIVTKRISGRKKPFYAGEFCSWLVAGVLEELGWKLSKMDPIKYTPANLARSRKLREIDAVFKGAIVEDRPEFSSVIERLRFLVGSTSLNAQLSKTGARSHVAPSSQFADKLVQKVRRSEQPETIAKILDDLINESKHRDRKFMSWQKNVEQDLRQIYAEIARYDGVQGIISQCSDICVEPYAKDLPCSLGATVTCRRALAWLADFDQQQSQLP